MKESESERDRFRLLELLLEEEGLLGDEGETAPLDRSPSEHPLTGPQRRIWFLEQLNPGLAAFHVCLAFEIEGPVAPAALAASLDELVRRHDALRSSIAVDRGEPRVRIAERAELPLAQVDLSGLAPDRRPAPCAAAFSSATRAPFDLSRAPLARAQLVRLSAKLHRVLLVVHHLSTDAWSMSILMQELASLYRVASSGRASPLPRPQAGYAGYARWVTSGERQAVFAAHLSWWRERLTGAPQAIELPFDRPRPRIEDPAGASVPAVLPAKWALPVRRLASAAQASVFMVLVASLAAWLHRLGAGEDLVIGTPVANRLRLDHERTVGLFANTLPLRLSLAGEPSFAELIGRVREAVFAAFDHQEMELEQLVAALDLDRAANHAPICQVVLTFVNAREKEWQGQGIAISTLETDLGSAKYDLQLALTETAERLEGGLTYRSALLDRTTALRWIGHWRCLLGSALAASKRRIGELDMSTRSERHQLLREWGAREVADRDTGLLHLRFGQVAARTPDAVAATSGDLHLSYGALARRARALARRLRRLGVGPEDRVALSVERAPELCAGILGILETGAAYVPLDPGLPAERRAFVLADTKAAALVVDRPTEPIPFAEATELPPILRLDRMGEDPGDPAERLDGGMAPEGLAYVIFTSGSTGSPKGVAVAHRSVLALFDATREAFAPAPEDVWTLFHSAAFDFSVWEIWGALLFGGRLAVVPFSLSRSPEDFFRLLLEQGVTRLSQTPSAFRQLARVAADPARPPLPALGWIMFGGEALAPADCAPWQARYAGSGPVLANLYGITEITVHATLLEWPRAVPATRLGSPVGRALPHLAIRLLDRRGEPVPIGVPGEICVGGAGLARGYLGRPELTAARFVPDLAGGAGDRLYRSGDLGRFMPAGGIEVLGRIDHQVKIRGFRVELGEIEAVLSSHPAIAEAAVALRDDRLAAYFVAKSGSGSSEPPEFAEISEPSGSGLRRFLAARLPEHMLPAAFVRLPSLPLTGNGKVDRNALPRPSPTQADASRSYRAPESETEEVLAGAWAQVLEIEQVGLDDNFFALGGDSLLSLKARALAEERGVRFSVQQLFATATLRELAREIEASSTAASAAAVPPFALLGAADRARLDPDVEDAYPLTAVQAGMLFHMGFRPDAIIYHNVYSYHLRAPFSAPAFAESARAAAARHPILRTSFDLGGGSEPLQRVHRTVRILLAVPDLTALPPRDQERALDDFVAAEKARAFDLSRPPLIRFALHPRDRDTFNLTFTECHPIFDGWSLHSFLAELLGGYFDRLEGLSPEPRPRLARGVADFVALERAAAASDESAAYWRGKLAGWEVWKLPREEGESLANPRIRVRLTQLPAGVAAGLERLARQAAVPFKSVLLAAHLKVLSRLAGSRDVTSGLLANGRPEGPDGDRILGLFFHVVPLRAALAPGSWRDLARQAFDAECEMMPHRRYPLARVQAAHGGAQLFEVLFNFIHFHMLRDLLASGRLTLLGQVRRWEETNFPLSVVFLRDPTGERLTLWLRYDEVQFGACQLLRFQALFLRALEALAERPEARHESDLLLSSAERHQVLAEWASGPPARPGEPFHRRFARMAARRPGAPAAVAAEGELSYGELARRAHRLAHRLIALGIGAEDRVGVFLPRGLDALAAILGVLHAGAAYVPFDPLHPRERIAALGRGAGVRAWISHEALAAELGPLDRPVIRLDADRASLAGESAEDPGIDVLPAQAAYVLFTSGSTGRPKGVVVEHRQVAHYLDAAIDRLELPPGATYALVSTLAADLGNTALLPALATGGCLRLASEELIADLGALEGFAARHPSDLLKIVPSHLGALLASARARDLLPRRRLVLGGEALPGELVERLQALGAACEIWNHYGPTETTVGVAALRAGPVPRASVPLGRPLAGVRLLVLDADLAPLPLGGAGELAIGGGGLARGYLGDAAATAERFVPDPWSEEPGARLYRSGDRVRHLPDGCLDFLGRIDHQVKIRGFRVELAEAEAAIARHPEISEVVVTAPCDRAGERRLVAYFVAREGCDPADADLRAFLRRRLPEPMLPSAWLRLESLPRGSNGKVDRAALPEPRELATSWQAAYVAPESPLERLVAAIWSEVLGVPRVGADDGFLDLGGHSLAMLRVHGKLRAQLDREVTMVDLFEHPTVRTLARFLGDGGDRSAGIGTGAEAAAEARASARQAALRRTRRAVAVEGGEAP